MYLQPEGRGSDSLSLSAGGLHRSPKWPRGLDGEEKSVGFRSMTVLHKGTYPISPNSLLKSHLIIVHLYRSGCVEFLPVFCAHQARAESKYLAEKNKDLGRGGETARGKPHTLLYMLGHVRGKKMRLGLSEEG